MIKRLWIFILFTIATCGVFVFHTTNIAHNNHDIKIFFTPGTQCEDNIISAFDAATHNVDIAVYAITNRRIADAILAAHNRGVRIRIVTDRMQSRGRASLITKLQNAGIRVMVNKKYKIEHNKFAIFDGTYIVSGSYNWTENATKYNSENCIFFTPPNTSYPDRFRYLWNLYVGFN